MNEADIREHVKNLRRFYTDFLVYLAVNAAFILLWLISGAGYFWPIWVIIGWGIGLGIQALSLGLIPHLTAMLPFMSPGWEDKEVRRVMDSMDDQSMEGDAEPEREVSKTQKKPKIKPLTKT